MKPRIPAFVFRNYTGLHKLEDAVSIDLKVIHSDIWIG
jgi:hypothetical protein